MSRISKGLHIDEPLRHAAHKRPISRRDFVSQGFMAGAGTVVGTSMFSMFANPRSAMAALSPEFEGEGGLKDICGIKGAGAGKIPFICFDLAGGANIAGSNVLVGQQGGQLDFLSTSGYSKLGLPGDMIPPILNPDTGLSDFINTELGLAFHSDSAFLRGIIERTSPTTRANINGAVIPARSNNDTGNNPHNPMYGIAKAGSDGSLLNLIGSSNSESGGNSMAPAALVDPEARPSKIDRPSDVTGLVDIGDLTELLGQEDAVAVMESIYRISNSKLGQVDTQLTSAADALVKQLVECGYIKSADIADRFGDPSELNPELDTNIVAPSGAIFTTDEFNADSEFRKTASVMKLVTNGYAGAGTITMGGYDYHTGNRSTGEQRDLRAGRCMGACLEYAARAGVPLMMYVFSDGSVSSNGMIDESENGRGKGVWTSDNGSTATPFFLVYNPGGRPQLMGAPEEQAMHQQIGYMSSDASVSTASSPAANNVNLLVNTVLLNYMALHGEQENFGTLFPGHGLGNAASQDAMTAFERGTI
ncbi:MAG: hypothetical protein KUG72_02055 [Pseudomonadales bacterium]|nr:hypothetical protein [Pseudomonadales bacterium]